MLKIYDASFSGQALGGEMRIIATSKEEAKQLAKNRLEEYFQRVPSARQQMLQSLEIYETDEVYQGGAQVVHFWDGDY